MRPVPTAIRQAPPSRRSFPRLAFYTLIALIVALSVPVILSIGSIRLLMTPAYLTLEYNKPGFPPDSYGLTLADRLHYAPYAVEFLTTNASLHLLGDLTFPDGSPFFQPRELLHMNDVQHVTQAAFLIAIGVVIALLIIMLWAARSPMRRRLIRLNLAWGASFTLMVIAILAFGVFFAWDSFFTGFHELFFSSGTWLFNYSDSLIRLFPVQFWQDAAITVGLLVTIGALIILIGCWLWGRRAMRQIQIQTAPNTPPAIESALRS